MSALYTGTRRRFDINIATSGDNTIIAAPTNGKICIDYITFLPTVANTIQFKDGATAFGGPLPLDTKQPFTAANSHECDEGVMTMSRNSAFIMNLGSSNQVGGFGYYRVFGDN
jgi:hypothetical protein